MDKKSKNLPKGSKQFKGGEPSEGDSSTRRQTSIPKTPGVPPDTFLARVASKAKDSTPVERKPRPAKHQSSPLASQPVVYPNRPSATTANENSIPSTETEHHTPEPPPDPLRSHPIRQPSNSDVDKPGSSKAKAPRTLGHAPYYSRSHPPLPPFNPPAGSTRSSEKDALYLIEEPPLTSSSTFLRRLESQITKARDLLHSFSQDLEPDFKSEELYDRLLRTFSFTLRHFEDSFDSFSVECQQCSTPFLSLQRRCESLNTSLMSLTTPLHSLHSCTAVLKRLLSSTIGSPFFLTQARSQWRLIQSSLVDLSSATCARDLRYIQAPQIGRSRLIALCDLLYLIASSWPKPASRQRAEADRADREAFTAFYRKAMQALDALSREQAKASLSLSSAAPSRLAVPAALLSRMETAEELGRVMEARWSSQGMDETFLSSQERTRMQRVVGAVVRFDALCVAFLDTKLENREDFRDGVWGLVGELDGVLR